MQFLDCNPRPAPLNSHGGVHHLLEDFYAQKLHAATPSMPYWGRHCLEIPVSLPDDELLVDRSRIRDPDELTAIWSNMLDATHQEGELFNLLFHPERIPFLAKPLDSLLEKATSYRDVWISSLDDIARWWQERRGFSFQIVERRPGIYEITTCGNAKASVTVQHPGGKVEPIKLGPRGTFRVHSSFRPVIAISPTFCNKVTPCLVNEGFAVEHDADPSRFAFAVDGTCSGSTFIS